MSTKRIMADILEINKPEYAAGGIYYQQNDADITKGYALIFGPKDSPYEDCPMFYQFQFPSTFPFDPPSVKFLTYDGSTRFHPNMYVDGKVCLSILGTWQGEKWASTMRLSTVLITLQSLMDNEPIRHEPAYANQRLPGYTKIVEHSCIRFILRSAKYLEEGRLSEEPMWRPFISVFEERWPEIYKRLTQRVAALNTLPVTAYSSIPYSMSRTLDYKDLEVALIKLKVPGS